MNRIPKEKTADFNARLKYWEVFPRKEYVLSDTIDIQKLVNTGISPRDIILFNLKTDQNYEIQPLRPRFTKLEDAEELYVIGCEAIDTVCNQKIYKAKMLSFSNGKFLLTPEKKVDYRGFSGGPVIDKNGYVIGVISAMSWPPSEDMYLIVEPIRIVYSYLN